MVTTQVVFQVMRSCIVPEVAPKFFLATFTEVFDVDLVDVAGVGGSPDVNLSVIDVVL